MAAYSFTTDQGWRVKEYRPFSPSYAVRFTPCGPSYRYGYMDKPGEASSGKADDLDASGQSDNLVEKLTGQQLKFDYLSLDVLRQLLAERAAIRDRHRSSILGRITDVSGDIYSSSLLRTPDSDKRKQGLEKTKFDLERELQETDERLWKDTAEMRAQLLISAARKFEGTYLRSSLFAPVELHDDHNERQGHTGVPDKMPGA